MSYNASFFIEKLLNYYNVSTISELAQILDTKQTSISSWRFRNSVNAIKKKCRELGIYNEIFGDMFVENFETSSNTHIKNTSNLSAYFHALESVAIATERQGELVDDIKKLIGKYIEK